MSIPAKPEFQTGFMFSGCAELVQINTQRFSEVELVVSCWALGFF